MLETGGFLWAAGDPEQKGSSAEQLGKMGEHPCCSERSDRTSRREAPSHMRDETMQEGVGKGATDRSLPPTAVRIGQCGK